MIRQNALIEQIIALALTMSARPESVRLAPNIHAFSCRSKIRSRELNRLCKRRLIVGAWILVCHSSNKLFSLRFLFYFLLRAQGEILTHLWKQHRIIAHHCLRGFFLLTSWFHAINNSVCHQKHTHNVNSHLWAPARRKWRGKASLTFALISTLDWSSFFFF